MFKPDQELERQFKLLQQFIGEIGKTFGTALSINSDPYDFSPDNRYSIETGYDDEPVAKRLFDRVDDENIKSQKLLLKNINVTLKKIEDLKSRQSKDDTHITTELNRILDQDIRFLNPKYALKGVEEIGGFIYNRLVCDEGKPVPVDLKINGKITKSTAKEVLEDVIPKMLLLKKYEVQLNKIQQKLAKLEEKSKMDANKYHAVYMAALDLTNIAEQAKEKIKKSSDLMATVTEISSDIDRHYDTNHKIFEEHRGYGLVNGFINLVRGLAGILIGILTLPWLFVNYEGTMENTKSFFKAKPTDSAAIFSFFKQNISYNELKKQAEMEEIEDINSLIQPLK